MKRTAWIVGALLALLVILTLALPSWLRGQAEQRLGSLLGRPVTIGALEWAPWRLSATLRDLAIGPAANAADRSPQLAFTSLVVNANIASLWQRAPVFEAVELDGLRARLTRTAEGHYDIDDLLARFAQPAAQPDTSEPARFALHNLQLRNAELRFDDRPVGRVHELKALTLTLPFLSNLPAEVTLKVEPRLKFVLNGSPFDSGAQALPFAQTREGELRVAFDALDIGPYLGYLPHGLPVQLDRAVLASDLRIAFAVPVKAEPRVALRGWVSARDVAVRDAAGAPLVGWQALKLDLRDVQPLKRQLAFGRLGLDGLALNIARGANGELNLSRLAAPAAATAASAPASASAPAPAIPAPAWQVQLDALDVQHARVAWSDTRPVAALSLDEVALQAERLRWPGGEPSPFKLAGSLKAANRDAGTLAIEGQANERSAGATLRVNDLRLDALAPYLAGVLQPRVSGKLAAEATLDWADGGDTPKLQVAIAQARLDNLVLVADREPAKAFGLGELSLAKARIDLLARSALLGQLRVAKPVLALDRGRDGVWSVQRWLPPTAPDAAPAAAAPPWQLRIDDFALDGGVLHLSDAAVGGDAPLQADVDSLKLRVQGLQLPGADNKPQPFKWSASARVGAPGAGATAGRIELNGQAALAPLQAQMQARIERFPVSLFAPYAADRMSNLLVQRADAGFQGRLAFSLVNDGLTLDLGGDVLLADVRIATRPDANAARSEELMSWQRLALDGVDVALKPGAKPRAAIRSATLADFYSRLIVTEQGRFNVRDVAGAAPANPASAASPAKAASTVATTTPTDLPFDLTIGQTKLVNGRVDFSDRFIKPNYSSRLTELNGQLGTFRSGSTEMAALEIHGRAAGTANLDIVGQLNPTANPPAMDLHAKASDLELAPFSPYAGKYAGYAIERGKLTADLAYKISPDGKLEASNQIILNQLTFGDKVESPDATSLPVRFAVALLKDRNGVIDINLPVSGSLQDPQFSLGGLIWRVIVNLITKAVTSPFALFSGGGSSGEDLSTVEFAPATATLSDASGKALDKVAQALIERPSLTMTVTGAADPQSEAEAERRLFLERRLIAERRRELARAGAAADAPPPTLSADDRARLVKEVYRQSTMPNKPRNALGFASDIPPAQMEALLRQNHVVSVEAMRELALQRGVAVRDALVARGLDSTRLFLAAPKIRVAGEDDTAGWTPRVQLVLAQP